MLLSLLYKKFQSFACILLFMVGASSLLSCKKDWLNQKPDSNQMVLQSLTDFQTLLDNPNIHVSNYLGEVGGDNYYIPEAGLSSLTTADIHQYLWAYDGYGVSSNTMWTLFYNNIFSVNTILSGLSGITQDSGNSQLYNSVYGAALFWRGFDFNELAQTFCKAYDVATAHSDPGIPLRLEADISSMVDRGTVEQTYNRIISDLKASVPYLPLSQDYKTRPTRWAAYATLARVYLSMGDYGNALPYADSAMYLNNHLLDYNIIANQNTGIPDFGQNPEVMLHCVSRTTDLDADIAKADTGLYASYSKNDLRKSLFFKATDPGLYSFQGSYDGGATGYLFSAPATDELYLTRAECYARAGNVSDAMNDLNTLLIRRFQTGTFTRYTAGNPADALRLIVTERRKELVMRMTRWTDLRRLNKDTRFATTITRIYHGQTYRLAPTSNWYVWPVPDDEILYSGITQNPR